ncbi:MAG: glycosyltransferase family 39 protein [Caldilineales bacterium]
MHDAQSVTPPPANLSARVSPETVYWALLLLFAIELAFWVLFRLVNLDEGWYLWAGKDVYAGRHLYSDFAYTQTPLLPYVYGLVQLLFGNSLYVGRVLTALFGFGAGALGAATARRIAGPWAGVFALAFLVTTFLAITSFAYTATYGLTAFLLAAAFYVAARLPAGNKRTWLIAACLALATAGRLASVVVFLPMAAFLIFSAPRGRRVRTALEFVFAATLLLALLLGPFVLTSGRQMAYDIFGFHMDRTTAEWRRGVLVSTLLETVRDFTVPVLLYAAAVVDLCIRILRRRRDWQSALRDHGLELTLAAAVALLYVAHLVPRTATTYYNVLQAPMIAILFGALAVRLLSGSRPRLVAAILAILLVGQVVTCARAVRFYDLTAWPPVNQVEIVRTAAAKLNDSVPPGSTLLTFDLHLALEAGLESPPGYEMSIFSYRPTWTTEEAQHYRVVNNELLMRDLNDGASTRWP